MKRFYFLAFMAIVMMGSAALSCDSRKSVSLKTDIDSVSYLIGANYGQGLRGMLKSYPEPGNIDAMISGFLNAAEGDSIHLEMDAQQLQAYLNTYFQNLQIRESEKTKTEGEKFLAENKTKEGVITTESGLQYKVLTEGTGIKPTPEDTVKVHYVGKVLDGTVFDSSVDRGEPATFALNSVIPGWTEGLQQMPTGSKYIFWIPSELAYGAQQPNATIKPNSTLEFEVELLEVSPAKK